MRLIILVTTLLLSATVFGQVTIRIQKDGVVTEEYTIGPGNENITINRSNEGRYSIKGVEPKRRSTMISPGGPAGTYLGNGLAVMPDGAVKFVVDGSWRD